MRKQYLDTIRWGTVLLVLVYHVFYLFNTAGVLGGINSQSGIKAFDALLYFVYPWFMALLFLISGISARYSLMKRSGKQFLGERVTKLIVPSTLGLFAYQWISGYLNIKIGGGMDFIPKPLIYPISAISGIGPLWFAQMLFVFSLLLVLIRKFDKKDTLWKLGGKANNVILLLLVFPLWGAAQLLNMPLLSMFRFGIYGFVFLLGYFVFSHDEVQDAVCKIHIPMLILAVVTGVCYTIYYFGENYTSPQCLQSIFTNGYLWIAILAILGCGKAWVGKTGRFSEYMAKSSFGFYVIHYPIVLGTCYLLYYICHMPMLPIYGIALLVTLGVTPLLYELLKRIPVLRYFVLGIKKNKSK